MFQFKQHIRIAFTTAFVFALYWQTITLVNHYQNMETVTEQHSIDKNKTESNSKVQDQLEKQTEAVSPEQEETNKTNSSSRTSTLLLVYSAQENDLSSDDMQENDADFFDPIQFC